jgi:hypothetical protein
MFKYCAVIAATFALTACGGGGGVTQGYSSVSVLSDASGVAKANLDSTTALVLIPSVDTYIANGNAGLNGAGDDNFELNQVPIIGTTSVATIRQGAVSASDGISQNITVYEINDATEGFGLIELPQYGIRYFIAASEKPLSNIPSGTFTYTGNQVVRHWQGGSFKEFGDVTINADFTNKEFVYSGSSSNAGVNGIGYLDTSTGKLTSVDASLIANGSAYTATIHGLLSGAGASSITGVFHTNDASPDYAGAFVAKK